MNFLNYLSLSHKSSGKLSKGTWFRLIITAIVGVALASLAALSATSTGQNFATSAWLLPTVALALAFVLLVNHIKSGKTSGAHAEH